MKIDFEYIVELTWEGMEMVEPKCKSVEEAVFYIRKTIENGYSRSALLNVIEADYYHTSGAAITNYSERLPLPQAQLAQEITKGNYELGFITLPANYDEKALENAGTEHYQIFAGTGNWICVCRETEGNCRFGEDKEDRSAILSYPPAVLYCRGIKGDHL